MSAGTVSQRIRAASLEPTPMSDRDLSEEGRPAPEAPEGAGDKERRATTGVTGAGPATASTPPAAPTLTTPPLPLPGAIDEEST